LLIQDEAHLLDESLGTFASLFESTLDAMLTELASLIPESIARDREGRPRRMKVIAASATVSRPERQLEHLFQRESPAIQIPYPGPDLYLSFYAGRSRGAVMRQRRKTPVRRTLSVSERSLGFMLLSSPMAGRIRPPPLQSFQRSMSA